MIPEDAVISLDGQDVVYVANGNRAQSKHVVTGLSDGKNIEIISGLKRGDRIIVSGHHRLKPSSKIEVK